MRLGGSLAPAHIISEPVTLDYLANSAGLREFFPAHFTQGKRRRRFKMDRERVVKCLRDYNEKMNAPSRVMESIDSLLDEDTYVVVSGQQPGVFSGPLYTVYKALSAIVISHRLSHDGRRFIPLFWNASEDHDLSEVDHIYLMEKNKPCRISYSIKGASRSAFEVKLDLREIKKVLEKIEEITPQTEFKEDILKNLDLLARESENLGDFFSRLLLFFFGHHGLVLIEPRILRPLMIPLFEKMIKNPLRSTELVNGAAARLKKRGYSPRIHKAPHLCGFFLRRQKVTYNGKFLVGGESFSSRELLQWLEENPFDFSSNVVTRSITQDYTLPTYAYVAGPSEIAYFAQLGEVYQEFGIEMPLIYPRFGATILENKVAKIIKKYGLAIQDLRSPASQIKKLLKEELGPLFAHTRDDVSKVLLPMAETVGQIDETLGDSFQASEKKIFREIDSLEKRAVRCLRKQNSLMELQICNAAENLFPLGELQERKINFLEYLIKFGHDFLEVIHQEFSSSNYGEHRVITFPD